MLWFALAHQNSPNMNQARLPTTQARGAQPSTHLQRQLPKALSAQASDCSGHSFFLPLPPLCGWLAAHLLAPSGGWLGSCCTQLQGPAGTASLLGLCPAQLHRPPELGGIPYPTAEQPLRSSWSPTPTQAEGQQGQQGQRVEPCSPQAHSSHTSQARPASCGCRGWGLSAQSLWC